MDEPRDKCVCCDRWFPLIQLSDQSLCEGCADHLGCDMTSTKAEKKVYYVNNVIPFPKRK